MSGGKITKKGRFQRIPNPRNANNNPKINIALKYR
jgi:hypothetical protein